MLRFFDRLSIKYKLIFLMMCLTGVILAQTFVFFTINEAMTLRKHMTENLSTLARVIGVNNVAAMMFRDTRAAEESLRSLAVDSKIVVASFISADGELFARYARDDRTVAHPGDETGGKINMPGLRENINQGFLRGYPVFDHKIDVLEEIVYQDENLGYVFLRADIDELESGLVRNLYVCALFLLISSIFAYYLALKLQRLVSGPILKLIRTMRTVSSEQNYAVRVDNRASDEVGALIDEFNGMLAQIETRDLKLNRHREELEEKIALRTVELAEANKGLEKMLKKMKKAKDASEVANRAKSEFLARMSHEIRTPMNAVIGMTHLVMETELTAKQYDYLKKIKSSANSLLGILNDILDFSKIEADRMELDPKLFSLESVLENLSDLVRLKAEQKEIELLFHVDERTPDSLIGDSLRLSQVLVNLTGNAVKFTDRGVILITIRPCESFNFRTPESFNFRTPVAADGSVPDLADDRVMLEFCVRDTGIGIPSEKIRDLFEPFSQADGGITRRFGGTGLGLSICKRLVEMMGGDIRVESEPGRGSAFIFTAVFGREVVAIEPPALPPTVLAGKRALVVDDCRFAREVMRKFLTSFSLTVETAASGEEALRALETADGKAPYDLLFIDWNMPVMNGIELVKRIHITFRGDGGTGRTLQEIPKIIMVTAYSESMIKQANRIDLEAILIKPVNRSTLLDTIMEAVGIPEMRRVKNGPRRNTLLQNGMREADARIAGRFVAGPRSKVLLVEDNRINQEVARELLKNVGVTVEIADNGKKAVDALRNNAYDLVLMDIQMPEMDGYEATRRIRSRQWSQWGRERENARSGSGGSLPKTPIIAMTAHAMNGERERCIAAGMDDYLSKPIDPDKLYGILAKWMGRDAGVRKLKLSQVVSRPETFGDSQAPVDGLPDSPAGFDIAAGLGRVNGNRSVFERLLRDFQSDFRKVSGSIRAALEENEVDKAMRLTHSLKGVAANLGAKSLSRVAGKLESAMRSGAGSGFGPLFSALDRELELILGYIEGIAPTSADGIECRPIGPAEPVLAVLQPILNTLDELLEDGDTEAGDYLERLAACLPGAEFKARLIQLREQMNNFNYGKAQETLAEISADLRTEAISE